MQKTLQEVLLLDNGTFGLARRGNSGHNPSLEAQWLLPLETSRLTREASADYDVMGHPLGFLLLD